MIKHFDNLAEIKKATQEVFAGKMLHAYEDKVILPNGGESTREYVKHIGAVAIVPVTEDGNVIVERIFRYPMSSIVTEIPAGKLNSSDENRLMAAKRELLEETGIIADEWIELGQYHPASAYSTEKIWLFMAKRLHKGVQNLDFDEFLEVEEMPLCELISKVFDGTIIDGKTQVGILMAAEKLGLLTVTNRM